MSRPVLSIIFESHVEVCQRLKLIGNRNERGHELRKVGVGAFCLSLLPPLNLEVIAVSFALVSGSDFK